MSETKTCSKCGKTYPATAEYFARSKHGRNGLYTKCKTCVSEYQHEYNAKNKARRNKYQREYRAKNPDYDREWQRENKRKNPEKEREYRRKYYQKHRERLLPQMRETAKKWRKDHLERKRAQNRRWRETHSEYVAEYRSAFSAANPERLRIYAHNRRARKLALRDDFTREQYAYALDYFGNVCAVCGRPFYDLFGERTLHLDHWIPLSADDCPGTTCANMIPLCGGIDGCNNRKNARDPEEWLVSQFGKRKARQILARIEAYFDAVRERFGDDDVA